MGFLFSAIEAFGLGGVVVAADGLNEDRLVFATGALIGSLSAGVALGAAVAFGAAVFGATGLGATVFDAAGLDISLAGAGDLDTGAGDLALDAKDAAFGVVGVLGSLAKPGDFRSGLFDEEVPAALVVDIVGGFLVEIFPFATGVPLTLDVKGVPAAFSVVTDGSAVA